MARLFIFVAILFTTGSTANSQSRQLDSLAQVLDAAGRTEKRVDILVDLAYNHYDFDSPRAFAYAMEAADLARDLGYDKGLRVAHTLCGFYFNTLGNYDSALTYYQSGAEVVVSGDDATLAYNYVLQGNAYRALARYDSAEVFYNRAVQLVQSPETRKTLAYAYRNFAELQIELKRQEGADTLLRQARAIYEEQGNKYGLAEVYFLKAQAKQNRSQFAEANALVDQGCRLANELDQDFLKLRCLMMRGQIALEFWEYTEALKYFFEVLGLLKNSDNVLISARVYVDIGVAYALLEQPQMARRYYLQALEMAGKIGARQVEGTVLANLARLSASEPDYPKAHEFVQESLKLRHAIGDDYGVSESYVVRGRIYYHEGQYEEAIQSFEKALDIRQHIGGREGEAACYFNMSLVHLAKGDLRHALELQKQGLAIDEEVGHAHSMAYSHNRLGNLYTQLRDYRRAFDHLSRAEAIASKLNSRSLRMYNHLYWSEYFDSRGNESRAFANFRVYAALRDSIHSEIDAQKLAELQALYVMERKDQEIRLLTQSKLLDQQQIDLQRAQINRQYIIIGSVVLTLLLLSLLMYKTWQYSNRMEKAHREISEQKEEIETQAEELREASEEIARINRQLEDKIGERTGELRQAYKELDTFFYRASHDFRRPLTTFMGLAEVAKVTVKDPTSLELFVKVRETASNLDKMLVKLQSISDMGSQQLAMKEVRLKEIFDTVCDNYRDDLERKHILVSADVNLQGPFVSYPALVRIIIENLVENAIHFSGTEKPYVKMKASQSGGFIVVEMRDNGQGISPEYQPHVFDMYFRANERSKGNGLGLYIVKKAVEKLDGSISLSSIALTGTTFTLMLPNQNGH